MKRGVSICLAIAALASAPHLLAQPPQSNAPPAARPGEAARTRQDPKAQGTEVAKLDKDPDKAAMEGLKEEQRRLLQLADRAGKEGRLDEAIAAGEKMMALEKMIYGPEHAQVQSSLDWIANFEQRAGKFDAARLRRQAALDMAQRLYESTHWKVINARLALDDLGMVERLGPEERQYLADADKAYAEGATLFRARRFAEAAPLAIQAVETRGRILGQGHRSRIMALNLLAAIEMSRGEHVSAEKHYLEVLDVRRHALGNTHPDTATSLNNLAQLYKENGEFAKALPMQRESAELNKIILGEDDPHTIIGMNNLGGIYRELGEFAGAEVIYRQGLDLSLKARGVVDAQTADCVNLVASICAEQGKLAEAEYLYRVALEIRTKTQGEDHPETVDTLSALGALYLEMGDKTKAEQNLQRALDTRLRTLGEVHADTAESLNNLASVYEPARAKPLLERAYEINRKVLPPGHPRQATSARNLGTTSMLLGDYVEAETRFQTALTATTQTYGAEHPVTAETARSLGNLYFLQGDLDRAAPLLESAAMIHRHALGQSSTTAQSVRKLALLYYTQGDAKRAEPLARESVQILSKQMKDAFTAQSERQKLLMHEQLRDSLDLWLSLARESQASSRKMYSELLNWKGMIYISESSRQSLRKDPEAAELFHQYQDLSRRLATTALAPAIDDAARTARDKQLEQMTADKESLEQELSRLSAGVQGATPATGMTPQVLQDALPEDAALVDFYEYNLITPPASKAGSFESQRNLLAFIIRRGRPLVGVDFGAAAPIAATIEAWRSCYGAWNGAVDRDPGQALRRQLWLHLAPHCQGAKTILISPDGAVSRLAFAALPGAKPNEYLIHEYAFATVPVAQLLPAMLAREPRRESPAADAKPSLLLVGNVDYGAPHGQADMAGLSRSVDSATRSAMLGNFQKLASTFDEINSVGGRFRERYEEGEVKTLDRKQATETAFRELAPRHRWIHLSTHGFFAPAALESALSRPVSQDENATLLGRGGGAGAVHPGLLAGLAMSGANVDPQPGEDDGILTALEVSTLDLTQVDTAVLSACETGLGREIGGEGLLGLQRAFQISGAKTTVSSLWMTPDRATMLLMQRFYRNLWDEKMPTLAALREAQLWMLSDPTNRGLNSLDAPSRNTPVELLPPKFWAAFVLSGDWR